MIYVSAVRAMNQEAVDDVWAAKHPSEQSPCAIGGALDLNQNPPREAFCSVFQYKSTHKMGRLLFAVDIHFHSTKSYPILCNLGELKWGSGKCIRWFTLISCIWTDLSIDKSRSLLNSCVSSCAHISYLCWQSLNIDPYKQRWLFYTHLVKLPPSSYNPHHHPHPRINACCIYRHCNRCPTYSFHSLLLPSPSDNCRRNEAILHFTLDTDQIILAPFFFLKK